MNMIVAASLLSALLFPVETPTAGGSPMEQMTSTFRQSNHPTAKQLTGNWRLIREVKSSRFLQRGEGADEATFDVNGIRKKTKPYWTLTFAPTKEKCVHVNAATKFVPEPCVEVTSSTLPVPSTALQPLDYSTEGELFFKQKPEADPSAIEASFACRISAGAHLVCLELDDDGKSFRGHALEFAKVPAPAKKK